MNPRSSLWLALLVAITHPLFTPLGAQEEARKREWVDPGAVFETASESVAKILGVEFESGVLVMAVKRGGAADRAGLRRGDLITAVQTKRVQSLAGLRRELSGQQLDQSVQLLVVRAGSYLTIDLPLKTGGGKRRGFGLKVAPLDEQSRRRGLTGVVVQEVTDGGLRDQGIQRGDVLVRITPTMMDAEVEDPGPIDVKSPAQLAKLIKAHSGAEVLILEIRRGDEEVIAVLEPGSIGKVEGERIIDEGGGKVPPPPPPPHPEIDPNPPAITTRTGTSLPAPVITTRRPISGAAGGSLTVGDGDGPLAGLRIDVPPGSVSDGREFELQAGYLPESPALAPKTMMAHQPGLLAAFVDRAMATTGRPRHPLYAPMLAAARGKRGGPVIWLGPSGKRFQKPVVVSMPLAKLGLGSEVSADQIVVVRSSVGSDGTTRWDVLDDIRIDRSAGTVVLETDHFSIIEYLTYVCRAGLWYGFEKRLFIEHGALAKARAQLPRKVFERFAAAVFCSGQRPTLDTTRVPKLLSFLWYLSRAADGDEATRKGLMEGHLLTGKEADLVAWIKTKYQRKEKPGSITVDALFEEALKLTKGDLLASLLLCHNTLRGYDGTNRDVQWLQGMMEGFRGDGRDERGARYHFFGTAAYALAVEHSRKEGAFRRIEESDSWATKAVAKFLRPEAVVEMEEAIVSGDILEDPKEFAIDLMGVSLGQRLFHEMRDRDPVAVLRTLKIDPATACGEIPRGLRIVGLYHQSTGKGNMVPLGPANCHSGDYGFVSIWLVCRWPGYGAAKKWRHSIEFNMIAPDGLPSGWKDCSTNEHQYFIDVGTPLDTPFRDQDLLFSHLSSIEVFKLLRNRPGQWKVQVRARWYTEERWKPYRPIGEQEFVSEELVDTTFTVHPKNK